MSQTGKPIRTVQSVDRAIAILQLLARSAEGLSLSQIASRLALAPQTAQGLARTLQAHQMVAQAGRGKPYCLGPAIHAMSAEWLAGHGPAALAREAVASLSRRIGEYVVLAELQGSSVIPLVEQRVDQPLMVRPASGLADRLHAMATGKMLLASLAAPQRESIVAQLDLIAHGPKTITSRRKLLAHLERVRATGHAVCDEEAGPDVAAMAVAVRGATSAVRAALGTYLPSTRFSVKRRKQLLAELRATAGEIERLWDARNAPSPSGRRAGQPGPDQ